MVRLICLASISLCLACTATPPTDAATGSSTDVATGGGHTSSAAPTTAGTASTSTGADPGTSSETTMAPEPACGDGVVNGDETCDDGKDGDNDDECTDLCAPPACGDTLVQASLGEECDNGGVDYAWATCTSVCKMAVCGDGIVNASSYQEFCDDGNDINDDSCSNACAGSCCPDLVLLSGTLWTGWRGDAAVSTVGFHRQYLPFNVALAPDGSGLAMGIWAGGIGGLYLKDGAWGSSGDGPSPVSNVLPAVSAHDGGFHVAYQGEDDKYYYAHFDGTTWNPKAEPIPIAGNMLGTLATLGGNAVYVTQDKEQANVLVVMERAPTWQAPVPLDAGGASTRPSMVAMAGDADLMVLRSGNYFVRKAGQWTTSGQMPGISPSAVTPGLAGLTNGNAAASWRKGDDTIVASLYDMATDIWTEPEPIGASPGAPAIATGVGSADVEVAYNTFIPNISIMRARLIGGVWTSVYVSDLGGGGTIALASHQ